MINKFAKIIRIISLPPFVVSILSIILYQSHVFSNITDGLLIILFLGIIPAGAYPLSYIIPNIKAKERSGQRKLAFILSLVGYSLGLIYALVNKLDTNLIFIYLTYFISLVILTFVNKVIKIKASGHM